MTERRTFSVVPMTPSDAAEVVALARQIWNLHYPGIISRQQIDYMLAQRYTVERLQHELTLPTIHWDLARDLTPERRALGFASTIHLPVPGELKLDKLYVQPALHGGGIGRALVELALARARQLGCSSLMLAVNKHNDQAIAAYRRFGFEVRDAITTEIGGGFVMDDFIMARSL